MKSHPAANMLVDIGIQFEGACTVALVEMGSDRAHIFVCIRFPLKTFYVIQSSDDHKKEITVELTYIKMFITCQVYNNSGASSVSQSKHISSVCRILLERKSVHKENMFSFCFNPEGI